MTGTDALGREAEAGSLDVIAAACSKGCGIAPLPVSLAGTLEGPVRRSPVLVATKLRDDSLRTEVSLKVGSWLVCGLYAIALPGALMRTNSDCL